MQISKLRKNIRAISPVLAVLMMIVIAVAGSLVTYAWVMGYLSFTTAKAGRAIQIQSIANDETDTDLLVYVQNVGEGVVTLDPTGAALVYVNGGLLPCTIDPADGLLGEGATATILVPGAAGAPGEQVRVKVVDLGGTFTEAAAYPGESTGGGGGIITPPPTITRVQHVEGTSPSFSSTPTEGNLLIVIAGHRSQSMDSGYTDPTATDGYVLAQVSRYKTGGSVTDRRAVAIFYKVAGPGESTSAPTITWNDGYGGSHAEMMMQEFSGAATWAVVAGGGSANAAGGATTITVPGTALTAGGTDHILAIVAIGTRDSGAVSSYTNDFTTPEHSSASNFSLDTAFSYTATGTYIGQTEATWGSSAMAVGALVFIQVT
jgi:hypothetical protein